VRHPHIKIHSFIFVLFCCKKSEKWENLTTQKEQISVQTNLHEWKFRNTTFQRKEQLLSCLKQKNE
jgi:hypothetical protein